MIQLAERKFAPMNMLFGLYLSLIAAVVPTLIFVLIFYWADRYEREPGWLAAVAFLWGAIPAIIASAIIELVLGIPLGGSTGTLGAEVIASALFAPVVEELAKGVALLGIVLWTRNEFDDVLDGLIYGALVGFGFAMTENVLYFIGAFGEGGVGSLGMVFVLRVMIFGLNHSFYTGLTGIGFGLARNAQSVRGRRLWPILGLFAAILTHSLHNFGASVAAVNAGGLLLSLAVAAGGFCTILLTVLLAWQSERNIIRTQLAGEVGSLLDAEEFNLITTRWRNPLRKRPAERANAGRQHLLVELALQKQRLLRLGEHCEPQLPAYIEQLRLQLAASQGDAVEAG